MSCEEDGRTAKELGTGVATLVCMDLGVGKPGMVIDGGMHVVVAHARGLGSPHLSGASSNAMTTALRNATQLLHVDVNQLSGHSSLVAADHLASGPIHPVQAMHLAAAKHGVTRRAGNAEDGPETMRPELVSAPQFQDAFFVAWSKAPRTAQRTAAPILQAVPAFGAIPPKPLVRSGTGDTQRLCGHHRPPALEQDRPDEQLSSKRRQPRPTMTHESPPFGTEPLNSPETVRPGLSPCQQGPWELHLDRARRSLVPDRKS